VLHNQHYSGYDFLNFADAVSHIYNERGDTMLRVAAAGCYSINHPGKEAELAAAAAALRVLSPEMEITIFSHNTREARRIPGVRAVSRWNPFVLIYTLLRSDIVLSCGGDTLQDNEEAGVLLSHLLIILTARLFGKPVVAYAQGVGPLKSFWRRRLARIVYDRLDLITVRSQGSKDNLLKMGVERPPIVVTADPLFAVNPALFDKEPGSSLLAQIRAETSRRQQTIPDHDNADAAVITADSEKSENAGDTNPVLGIVLQELAGSCRYKHAIASAADRLARDGWDVLLIPFQYPADLQVCQEVGRLMQEPSLQYREKLSLEQLFGLFGEVDLLLGMRLPALIMASVMRKPCIGIAGDEQTAKFLEMTEQPKIGIEELDESDLSQLIISAYEMRKEIAAHLDQVLIQLRQQSWESAGLTLSYFYSRCPHKRGGAARGAAWPERHKTGRTAHHGG
jgi:polysaccharide pyruvyl transferase CsaB